MNLPARIKPPSWLNRNVFGWSMFDFANQAFTLVILTAMFNVYFTEYIVPTTEVLAEDGSVKLDDDGEPKTDASRGRQLWAVCGVITQILIILLGPILGAIADFTGAKKKLLLITWLGCVVFTASLGLVGPGAIALGMTLFIVAYLFYGAGENFMASFLPEISTHRTMGRVSAFGWTVGYIGGLLCLAGAVVLLFTIEAPNSYRWICVWAGVFFFFGALPTFILLRERKEAEEMPAGYNYVTIGFRRLKETFRELRQFRWLFQFLLIMTVYFAGLQIIFWFAGVMTRELFGFGEQKMGIFILQITLTAIVGAVVTANVQDRIGARNFLLICMAFWTLTILSAAFATQEVTFWIVGNAIGLGIGALGTASRAMVGLFSPQHKAAEFFGFFGFAHKLAAIIGLSSMTLAEFVFAGNFHYVAASGSIFFILGFGLLWTIDEKKGRISALKSERAFRRRAIAASDAH
ncbi:MAG: MFS transporter [Phycisphaerales bacterium]|nr:MAG: MFS transporter [Phycisphaerales bacterium]